MNEFTKDELIWMSSRIFYGMETNVHGKMIHKLRTKLKSMIDNYHEEGNHPDAWICKTCGGNL